MHSLLNQDFFYDFYKSFSDKRREDKHEHNTGENSLGFGFVHYSMVRNITPKKCLAIGSRYGLIPACIAIGLKDNNLGVLDFVDANYDDEIDGTEKGYGGKGYWSKKDPFKEYGLDKIVSIHIETTKDFFYKNENQIFDYIYIDGDHSYEGVKFDFLNSISRLAPNGIITLHDYHVKDGTLGYEFGIGKFVEELDRNKYNVFVMPVWPGLVLVQRREFQDIGSKL